MRSLAFILLLASVQTLAHAAVVEGVTLDEETGNPLARAQVTLVPLPGTLAAITPVKTGPRGSFVILSVRPGWYILRATRRGYSPAESGQLKPGRPGHAFEVADDRSSGFIEIRMSHMPAITGTVLDENSIGIPKWRVHVYTARKPIRHVAQTITDERGGFRIGELEPGTYFVRSGPGSFEDETTVLATYSKTAVELGDAVSVHVRVGETLHDVIVRPVKGRFLTLSGMLLPVPLEPATLTLVTDTDRRDIVSGSNPVPFTITGVQRGPVELIVDGVDSFGKKCGSYTKLLVDKDVTTLRLACGPYQKTTLTVTGVAPRPPLFLRRVDLDGVGESHPFVDDELLAPGHWELTATPGDYYIRSVRNNGTPSTPAGAWLGFDAGNYSRLTVAFSSTPTSISGVVSTHGNPVAGAPIFLEDVNSGQTWTGRADPQGNYKMRGLPPGQYKIASGFDFDPTDASLSDKWDDTNTAEGNVTTRPLELILP